MRQINLGTWQQKIFYVFTFFIGFIFQPDWFFKNVYSFELWRDTAWVVNRYTVYSIFSGLVLCFLAWLFSRFAKKFL